MPERIAATLAIVLLLTAAQPARAHKMMAAARTREDGTALIQAFFPDGRPAREVRVEVLRPDGTRFAEGTTDGQGRFTVAPDGTPGRWRAVVTGSMGHRAETDFRIGPGPAGADASPPETAPDLPTLEPAAPAASPAEEEGLIQKEPFPWTGCLAGLGFVFGLSALLMCLKLRSELRRLEGSETSNSD
ncbi:MAG: hypothetical protein PVJ27_02610 [Candidatus Brocadiaceae bacterium]|jgi:hypothetical protein